MRKLLLLMLALALALPAGVALADMHGDFDCGTDEEVTIKFFGDPVGSHPVWRRQSDHQRLQGSLPQHHC